MKKTNMIISVFMAIVSSMMISCANPSTSDLNNTDPVMNEKYIVTFKNGNDIIKTVEVGHGEKIPSDEIPAKPTKEGYTFDGWGFNFDHNIITRNTTINATFKNNVYVVVFKDPDGNIIDTENVYYGDKVTRPSDLKSDSEKEFAGWKNGDNRFDFNSDVIKSDMELVAYYKERIYLSFEVDHIDKGYQKRGVVYGVESVLGVWTLKYHLDTRKYTNDGLKNPYDYLTIKINGVELKAVDTVDTERFIPNKGDVLTVEIKESEKYEFTIANDHDYGNIDINNGSYTF